MNEFTTMIDLHRGYWKQLPRGPRLFRTKNRDGAVVDTTKWDPNRYVLLGQGFCTFWTDDFNAPFWSRQSVPFCPICDGQLAIHPYQEVYDWLAWDFNHLVDLCYENCYERSLEKVHEIWMKDALHTLST